MKVLFVSLGCDKNLVDSEMMMGLLRNKGYEFTDDETIADVIVINTCGFINDAKEESINTIISMAEYKENNLKALIVTGCLAQRYKNEILEELPEIDIVITMGCNVQCPFLPCKHREDWGLDDPSGKKDEAFLYTMARIKEKVLDLKKRIQEGKL